MGSSAVPNRAPVDKTLREREWTAFEAMRVLSDGDRALWDACNYVCRPTAYYNKILVVWELLRGEPHILETLSVQAINISFQSGVWLQLYADVAGREVHLNHSPRRILDLDVFGWVPYFSELRYVSERWDDLSLPRNMRANVLAFKARSNPDIKPLHKGRHYISEAHVFREMFPSYAHTRF